VSEKTEVRVGGDSLVQESIYGASHERHGDGANLFVIQARFEVGCQFNIDEVEPMCWSASGKVVVS
jgi:hypothetical protein